MEYISRIFYSNDFVVGSEVTNFKYAIKNTETGKEDFVDWYEVTARKPLGYLPKLKYCGVVTKYDLTLLDMIEDVKEVSAVRSSNLIADATYLWEGFGYFLAGGTHHTVLWYLNQMIVADNGFYMNFCNGACFFQVKDIAKVKQFAGKFEVIKSSFYAQLEEKWRDNRVNW